MVCSCHTFYSDVLSDVSVFCNLIQSPCIILFLFQQFHTQFVLYGFIYYYFFSVNSIILLRNSTLLFEVIVVYAFVDIHVSILYNITGKAKVLLHYCRQTFVVSNMFVITYSKVLVNYIDNVTILFICNITSRIICKIKIKMENLFQNISLFYIEIWKLFYNSKHQL